MLDDVNADSWATLNTVCADAVNIIILFKPLIRHSIFNTTIMYSVNQKQTSTQTFFTATSARTKVCVGGFKPPTQTFVRADVTVKKV